MASFVAVVVGFCFVVFFFLGGGGCYVLFKKVFFCFFVFFLLFWWKICNVSVMYLLLYVHVCVTRTGWKTRPRPKTVILPIKKSKKSNQICRSNLQLVCMEIYDVHVLSLSLSLSLSLKLVTDVHENIWRSRAKRYSDLYSLISTVAVHRPWANQSTTLGIGLVWWLYTC